LTTRPQIVALNKIEGLDDDIVQDRMKELKKALPKGTLLFAISAQSKLGVKELLYKIKELVAEARAKREEIEETSSIPILRLKDDDSWRVEKTDEGFKVVGQKIERFAERTDFANHHAVERLRDIMKKMGIMHELYRKGIEAGDSIKIGENSIEY
jgi:GTPase